ncbi:hypothetical protein [Candidimonas nitroreducens]|uniref:Uncharacterized protein n=1 Tax=Candidimonas nitroreducens TaxID=683354 RepID=A0A225MRI3_9BURK|nr:hypothetical protein [Candidimonas nitroreducens]OWT63798.1 hypothetical protein CEY11_05665 [Candidimonas nitroreducens]
MEYDEDAASEQRVVIRLAAEGAKRTHETLSDEQIQAAIKAFARVTPPRLPEEKIDITFGLITVDMLRNVPSAESRKPGNVVLNWRKLVDIVPDIYFAGLGAATAPLAPALSMIFAGLYIWNKLWKGSAEDFSKDEAIAILALWKNRDAGNKIGEDDGLMRTNELRVRYDLPPISRGQFAAIVDRFVGINCIELENGVIWLRESIRVRYG